jgi:endoglucanase
MHRTIDTSFQDFLIMYRTAIAALSALAACGCAQSLGRLDQGQVQRGTPLVTSVAGHAPPGSVPMPDSSATLEGRMKLFRNGALRGFALSALLDDGVEIYTDTDFEDLASTGANVVRVPIHLHKSRNGEGYDLPEEGIRYAERVLNRGERLGFRVIIVLHPMPGFGDSDYWENASLKAEIVRNWGLIAGRLKYYKTLQAYDLINEPVIPDAPPDRGLALWLDLAAKIARELRAVDPHTPLIVEPIPWGLPSSFWQTVPLDIPGVVYGFHFYEPHEFTHQGLPGYPKPLAYPSTGWDRKRMSQAMDEARRFAAKHKVPMFIGEFSCVRWAPNGSCPRHLADAVSLFDAEGWGWAYHCWRCYQGMDAEVPQHIPKEQRSGLLPKHRQADTPTMLLLKKSMESNRKNPSP